MTAHDLREAYDQVCDAIDDDAARALLLQLKARHLLAHGRTASSESLMSTLMGCLNVSHRDADERHRERTNA